MMWFGLFGLAWGHPCETADLEALFDVRGPAVVVLGERHGARSDLKRARKLVDALTRNGPVTLAMEAVHEVNQSVLDEYAVRRIKRRKLADALSWSETWGYPWGPYKKLVTATDRGVPVVAAGLTLGPKPADREVVVPDGYAERLMGAMHGHGMSDEVRERFPTSMAWRDYRIAELAVEGWSGDGVLVILTGRGHVQGGLGTNWQLDGLTDAPVFSVILAHEGAACLPGDSVWPD